MHYKVRTWVTKSQKQQARTRTRIKTMQNRNEVNTLSAWHKWSKSEVCSRPVGPSEAAVHQRASIHWLKAETARKADGRMYASVLECARAVLMPARMIDTFVSHVLLTFGAADSRPAKWKTTGQRMKQMKWTRKKVHWEQQIEIQVPQLVAVKCADAGR